MDAAVLALSSVVSSERCGFILQRHGDILAEARETANLLRYYTNIPNARDPVHGVGTGILAVVRQLTGKGTALCSVPLQIPPPDLALQQSWRLASQGAYSGASPP